MEIQNTVKENIMNSQLYVNKTDNLKEMDKFLEIHSPLKLSEELDNLNRQIIRSEMESVI